MAQLLKSVWAAVLLLSATASFAFAPRSFGGLAINSADDLLFTISGDYSGDYQSLYLSHLGATGAKGRAKSLTCYPEQLFALNGGKSLYIRNRFGTARYDSPSSESAQSLTWLGAGGEPLPAAASPDGRWLCYADDAGTSQGRLVLRNLLNNKEVVLVEDNAFDAECVPAKWSPDSKFVLYEKDGAVYFADPEYAFKTSEFSEDYRKIGAGGISSVQWTRAKSLIYIDGDIIYRIQEHELYIRGLYSYFIGNSSIVGRLLYPFDPAKDSFWCNEKGSKLVINTADKFVSYCAIQEDGYGFVTPLLQMPLAAVAGLPLRCQVFWPQGAAPLLWVDYFPYTAVKKTSSIYTLSGTAQLLLSVESSVAPALSPDGRYLAFSNGEELFVYRLADWKCVATLGGEKTKSVAWATTKSLYVGGEQTVRLLEFNASSASSAQKASLLFLSSVYAAGWSSGRILARSSESSPVYIYDAVQNCWSVYERGEADSPRQANGHFRVFLGKSENSNYANAIFVRPLGTEAYTYLLTEETRNAAPAVRKASLCFDLMDTAEGLAPVLASLEKYGVRATFFINGEFMRRYPQETRLLASSGHACASLFSSPVDLLTKNYRLDKEFIKRGLARNEDEFFAVTGGELSLLWHAPYGKSNAYIVEAGEESGYTYIELSAEKAADEEGLVFSFRLGETEENIDRLLSSLLKGGYEISTVQDVRPSLR